MSSPPFSNPYDGGSNSGRKGRLEWSASYKRLCAVFIAGLVAMTTLVWYQQAKIDDLQTAMVHVGNGVALTEYEKMQPFNATAYARDDLLTVIDDQRLTTAGFYAFEQRYCLNQLDSGEVWYSHSQMAVHGATVIVVTDCVDPDGNLETFRTEFDMENGSVITYIMPKGKLG